MPDIAKGYTWTSGETVTPKKLNDALDQASLNDNIITTNRVVDGAITGAKLASNSVSTAKIVDASVTNAKIADGSVTNAKIADASVTQAKIATGAVSADKLGGDFSKLFPKAWAVFNNSGTLLASYNVSGVNRSATGTYEVTFTTALTDANYCVVGSASASAASANTTLLVNTKNGVYTAPTTTKFSIETRVKDVGLVDPNQVHFMVHGN